MNDKMTPSLMKIKRDMQHRVKIYVMASNGIRGVVTHQIFFNKCDPPDHNSAHTKLFRLHLNIFFLCHRCCMPIIYSFFFFDKCNSFEQMYAHNFFFLLILHFNEIFYKKVPKNRPSP